MRRVVLVGGLALVILAFSASATWACNLPTIGVSQNAVHPGDSVLYTIIELTSGAQFTVRAGYAVVADGTADGGTVSGSFAMPDMGPSAEPVSVEVTVHHADIENPEQAWDRAAAQPIRYAGYASSAGATPQEPAAQPTAQPAPNPVQSAPLRSDAAAPSPPSAPPASGHATTGPRPAAGGSPRAVHQPGRHSTTGSRVVRAPQRVTVHRERPGALAPAVAHPAIVATARHAAPAAWARSGPDRPARERVQRDAVPAGTTARRPPDAALVGARSRTSLDKGAAAGDWVLIALAVAAAAVAFTMRRPGWGIPVRRGSPASTPPAEAVAGATDDLAIEAELQEMIAEERARAVARSPGGR